MADQIYKAAQDAAAAGDRDRASSLIQDNRGILSLRSGMEGVERSLSVLNRQMRAVSDNREMSADEKRERIIQLNAQRNELARRVMERVRAVQ